MEIWVDFLFAETPVKDHQLIWKKFARYNVPANYRKKLTCSEKKVKYLDLARKLKKGDNYTNRVRCFWYSHQRIIKGTGGLWARRTSRDHPNFNIIRNGQNTEKSPGDLRRIAVTQTPVKNHQLKLMWKTFME